MPVRRYCLPNEVRTWDEDHDVNTAERQEFRFEAILLAHVRDSLDRHHGEEPVDPEANGELLLELEAFRHSHYTIMNWEAPAS